MCGRYVEVSPPSELAEYFHAHESPAVEQRFQPSFNVAPTRDVLGVRLDREGERELELFHWGLVPSWAKEVSIGNKLFNARAEGLTTKPAFRAAWKAGRRLLLLADGFYEWRKVGRLGDPYYFSRADNEPMAFAGLWEPWKDRSLGDEAEWLMSATIITTHANGDVEFVHNRMPVVLSGDEIEEWLEPGLLHSDSLEALLRPASEGTLVSRRVDRRVGSVTNDDERLLHEVEGGANSQ